MNDKQNVRPEELTALICFAFRFDNQKWLIVEVVRLKDLTAEDTEKIRAEYAATLIEKLGTLRYTIFAIS